MIAPPRLPPPYRLRLLPAGALIGPQLEHAVAAGADPATVFLLDRDDRMDCAVLLAPEEPLRQARLVVYAAVLGLGDGLGAVVPPGIDVTFRWPSTVLANLGAVARVGLVVPAGVDDDEVPPWMALRLTVAVAPPADGFETTLHDEGGAGLDVASVLESFARHFLAWINRWQDDGFDPVRDMWLRHAPEHGQKLALRLGRRKVEGTFTGIGDDGTLLLDSKGSQRRIDLQTALDA